MPHGLDKELIEENAGLKENIEVLKAALKRYGQHDGDCERESNTPDGEGFLTDGFREPCTCGFENALRS